MAYDEGLAYRIREVFADHPAGPAVTEKKMFGGIAFLVSGNMAVGVVGEELMVRVGPDAYQATLELPHARQMDFTGKPMKGFVYVGAEGCMAPIVSARLGRDRVRLLLVLRLVLLGPRTLAEVHLPHDLR